MRGIVVEGEQRYTEIQLIAALGQGIGVRLDPDAVERGLAALWDSFRVRAEVLQRPVEGGIELRLIVTELPVDREPRFIGNVAVDTDELLEWALLTESSELFVHQAPRIRQRLIENYRREGFYWVEIDVESRGGQDQTAQGFTDVPGDVIFEIREGPRVRVSDVVVRGNHSMPDTGTLFWKRGLSHLAGRELGGKSLFHWWGKKFVRDVLEADLVSMRTVYRDRGWLDAVVELDRLDFNRERDRVDIYIAVDEGARYTVSSVGIEAVRWTDPNNARDERVEAADLLFPSEQLLELCDLKPGVPFEATRLRHDETALRDYYGAQGYISHPTLPRRANWRFLEPLLLYDVENHTVAVTYRVAQGRKLRIREVFFSGTEHTRDEVTRRELSVHPGDLANLKEIQRSLARIQGTGYFSDQRDVDHREPYYRFVQVPESETPKTPEGSEDIDWIDLEFIVSEGRVLDFNLSGGIDTNSGLFGLIGLTMRNFDISRPASSLWALPGELYRREAFHGAGQRLDIELSPGTDIRRLRVRFLEPDVFNLHRNPISVEVDLQARDRRFDSHDEERTTERLRFGRRFTHTFSGFFGLQLAQIDIDDLDSSGVPPDLAAQEAMGRTDLNGFLLDFVHRDVDNYLTPHEGIRFTSNNSLFNEIISGDFEFVSTQQLLDLYRPFTYTKAGIPRVIHLEVNGGVSIPYGDTDSIPYSERYFLGGTSSLRGFDFRGVGPIDPVSGFAFGGESYIAGTLEFQFPLSTRTQRGTYREIETFRGQVFFDYGILDPEGEFPELDELRASVGFGFGLGAPFPLAFNFGFPVVKDKLDETRTFSFTLGFN